MDTYDSSIPQTDWELTEDYYENQTDRPEFKLEDFMDHQDKAGAAACGDTPQTQDRRFLRISQDVHNVLALARSGNTIQEIASQLNLDPQYVYDIQISAQGFREDDEIAVAHLVEMSL